MLTHDHIDGHRFAKFVYDVVSEQFKDFMNDHDKTFYNPLNKVLPLESERTISCGSVKQLPKGIDAWANMPGIDPINYPMPYIAYLRRFTASYALLKDFSEEKQIENPILLFYDSKNKYEIICGTHRFIMHQVFGAPVKANIYYHQTNKPELELDTPYDHEINYEVVDKIAGSVSVKDRSFRFYPKIVDVSNDFNREYLAKTLEFTKALSDHPQIRFYFNNNYFWKTPSRNDSSPINIHLSDEKPIWWGIMQFMASYFFDINEFNGKKYYYEESV